MTKVIGVRFRTAGKIYFFSPGEFEIKQGDHVIVETARGIEYGRVVSAPKEVDDDSVVQPLKSVIRIATEQDEKTVEKNRQKEKEAFKICQEKIRKHGLDMKLNVGMPAEAFTGKWVCTDCELYTSILDFARVHQQ